MESDCLRIYKKILKQTFFNRKMGYGSMSHQSVNKHRNTKLGRKICKGKRHEHTVQK